jgi:hypothetical protein
MRTRAILLATSIVILPGAATAAESAIDPKDEPAAPPAAPTPAGSTRIAVRAHGGFVQGALFGVGVSGPSGGVGLSVAPATGRIGFACGFELDKLATAYDLGIVRGILSASAEISLWRFRLGPGAHLGVIDFARASGSDGRPSSPTLGLQVAATFDVLRIAAFALEVGGNASLGVMPTWEPPPVWSTQGVFVSVGANAGLRWSFR